MIRMLKDAYHLVVAFLALCFFRFPGNHLTVIGVTGTDGKTTTTTLIYEILKKAGKHVSMITSVQAVIAGKTYDTGFHVTTPTAWHIQQYLREAVNHGDTYMVLEVTSHALSQYRVFGVPFFLGVITNITHEHLDWHKTFDRYLEAKMKLLRSAKTVVVNRDEETVYEAVKKDIPGSRIITYGMKSNADVSQKTFPFTTHLPGVFNQYNCLAAIAATRHLSIDKKAIRDALTDFGGVMGRMEVVYDKDFMVIVDFAHTPNALMKALETVRRMTKRNLIHVFGSAGLRDNTKRPLMGKASSKFADSIILTEEDYRTENVETIMDEIQGGIAKGKDVHRFPQRSDAIRFALTRAKKGDIVFLTGKGHEKSLCRGMIEYPWSDQEEVKKILNVI